MIEFTFTKMHGAGNDFVVIDALDGDPFDYVQYAERINDRRFGIGCDQLLVIRPSEIADAQMRIFNNDGGEVEMCGNGIRCLLKYLVDHHRIPGPGARIETLAGIIQPRMEGDRVRVDMGPPVLEGKEIPTTIEGRVVGQPIEVLGQSLKFTGVSMGNPHAIFFVEVPQTAPVTEIGPLIENHPIFPNRTNVEFAKVQSRERIDLRVWERGSGETLACGTGACATAVAAQLNGLVDSKVSIKLPGGVLDIEWDGDPEHSVFMTGAAVEVYSGKMTIGI